MKMLKALREIKGRLILKLAIWRANLILARVKRQYPGCQGAMNANSWPAVSGVTTGFTMEGVTTIRFGTTGLLQSPSHNNGDFFEVLRFNQKPLIENIKLPNGTGITSTRILLKDGHTFDITVRDDSEMTPPWPGDTWVITDAGGLLTDGVPGAVYSCKVVDGNYDTAVKQAGERGIQLENLLLVDNQISGSPV